MLTRSFAGSTGLCFLFLLFALAGCSSRKSEEKPGSGLNSSADETAAIRFETAEDKSDVVKIYELEHMKEWYPERILPPAFDFDIDISQKSITELWLLRNEIFARNGYLFEDAILRGYFNQFKWYQPVFDVPDFKVRLNKQEQDFVNKVMARENQLRTERYASRDGYRMVQMDHVYNQVQFKKLPQALMDQLAKTNFAIVPARHEQLFHVYDENHYQYIPSFIGTDIYLQVLHKHFSSILRRIEEAEFTPLLASLLKSAYQESVKAEQAKDTPVRQAAEWTTAYLAIAYTLLTDEPLAVPESMATAYKTELERIRTATGTGSSFLQSDLMTYSQFTPRGNYTRSPALENYFRCMKWLNTAPLFIDDDAGLLRGVHLAALIKRSPDNLKAFERFTQTIRFIVGEEDHLSLTHLISALSPAEASDIASLTPKKLNALRKKLESVDPDKIKPRMVSPDGKELTRPSVLFTAGRYTFDAEILIRLVHVLEPEPKRTFPRGLDVFAVLGSKEAENILIDEYEEGKKWPDYPQELSALRDQFKDDLAWDKNVYTKTMEAINSIRATDERHPLFMKTPSWERKNLITSLAAWTELKHDMLLYSEQPYAAQAGEGGGPPPPQHIGYVEPNIRFWKKALELIDLQEKTLERQQLLGEDIKRLNDDLREIAKFLLAVSEKEVNGEALTATEFDEISWVGGKIEWLTFRILDTDHLPEKERLVALVADVYRHNNNYLQEAVGLVDELYVIAEINGKPYLTRGTVFSYYEFTSDAPLSDEQWQKRLLDDKTPPRPEWTRGIMVNINSLETKETYGLLGAEVY
jgi:hypothetical protein